MTARIVPAFQGEVQLAGWSESHHSGSKVTFWLPCPSDLDAFRTLTVRKGNVAGHRLMAVLVEIGDDEMPVQPTPAPEPATEPAKGGPLAKWAALRCQDERFLKFFGVRWESEMRGMILAECRIRSRAELDSNPEAAGLFARYFRRPWADHCKRNGWAD